MPQKVRKILKEISNNHKKHYDRTKDTTLNTRYQTKMSYFGTTCNQQVRNVNQECSADTLDLTNLSQQELLSRRSTMRIFRIYLLDNAQFAYAVLEYSAEGVLQHDLLCHSVLHLSFLLTQDPIRGPSRASFSFMWSCKAGHIGAILHLQNFQPGICRIFNPRF